MQLGYATWQSLGGVATAIVVVLVLGGLGMIQTRIEQRIEYGRIKKEELARIRRSELKQKARIEIVRTLGQSSHPGGRPRASIPDHIMAIVFDRDQGRCVVCGSADELQFDHIVPHSKGGADTIENLRVLCRACNGKRGNRFL
jgi:5-methylcytosine-specific restriction endonuclease McrA